MRTTNAGQTRTSSVLATLTVCAALGLAGCQQTPSTTQFGPKTGIGAALGAAGGGLLAAAVGGKGTAIAGGVLLGGLAGGALGSVLDDQDRRTAELTTEHALETMPSGQTAVWHNPDTDNSGTVTPLRTYQVSNGQVSNGQAAAGGEYCREYEQTLTVSGQQQRAFGTACRQPDGTWRVVT